MQLTFLAYLVAGALASSAMSSADTRRLPCNKNRYLSQTEGGAAPSSNLPCRRYLTEEGQEAMECSPIDLFCLLTGHSSVGRQEAAGCLDPGCYFQTTRRLNEQRAAGVCLDPFCLIKVRRLGEQDLSDTGLAWVLSQMGSSVQSEASQLDLLSKMSPAHVRRVDEVYNLVATLTSSMQQGQEFDKSVKVAATSVVEALQGSQLVQGQSAQDVLGDVLATVTAVQQALYPVPAATQGASQQNAAAADQRQSPQDLFSSIVDLMNQQMGRQQPSDLLMDILKGAGVIRRLQHKSSDAIDNLVRAAQMRSLNLTNLIMTAVPSTGRVGGSSTRRRLSLVSPASRPVCTAEGCGPSVASAPAVVVQRDTVTTVVRETSCPDGMSLEGGVCVGLDLCPVSYTCPRGFVESDSGDCVTESQPLVDCPDRYTLHRGKVCTRGTVSQATYVCDTPGYVLDSVSKVCVKEIPQPNTCPPGFTMEVGSCVQKSAPQLRCGPGQTLSPNTRECVSTHTEPAALSCPDGAMQVDGERCVVIQQEAPYCPKRYTLDMATNTCVQSVPKICGECPSGFNRNGRTCERVERSPAEPSCDSADFELRGELCHKEIVQDSKCPAGTQKSSVNPHVCEKCVPSKPVCAEGNLRGDQCVIEVEQPGKECCAPGFKLEAGQCKRVEVSAPRLSCEGECFTVTSHPVAYACPVDSEFVPHPERPKCVRQTKKEVCAPVVEPLQCSAEAATRGLCQQTASTSCSDVMSSDTVPAEPYCPNGGSMENGRCVTRVPIVPERSCDVGTFNEATGQCTRTTIAPVKSECPAGSTRKGFTCVTEELRPANFVCPEGSDETAAGVCVVRSDAVPLPPKVVKQPPTYSCPMGGVLSGKQCLFSTTVEVPQVCPVGSQEGPAGCYTTAPLVVPPPVEKPVRPSFYCASPYATLAGRQCTVTERQRAEPFCTQDAYLQDNKCVRCVPQVENPPKTLTATPRPVCASQTAELRGCVCIEHDETTPLVSCANGFTLSTDGKCERRTDKTPLCPFGTELQGEACVRRVEVAPIVRVINGCEVAPAKKPVCFVGY